MPRGKPLKPVSAQQSTEVAGGDCYVQGDGAGCSDANIEACVCTELPECCTGSWTLECVSVAAACGDWAIVGAIRQDSAAFVFKRDDNGTPAFPNDDLWFQVAKLSASDGAGGDEFGWAVSISGDHAIVGAPGNDDACPNNPACNSGSAYIFRRDQGGSNEWGEVAKLTSSTAADTDRFGRSVSISGNTVIVGVPGNDESCPGDPNCDSGSVHIFQRDEGGPGNWGEVRRITASDSLFFYQFGWSVSMDGNIAIVGAPYGCCRRQPLRAA